MRRAVHIAVFALLAYLIGDRAILHAQAATPVRSRANKAPRK